MRNKLFIQEIKSKGESTISQCKTTINLFSLVFAFVLLFLHVRISKDLLDVLISSLAIFTGFFFTLIVYITDKSITKISKISEDEKLILPNLAFRKFKENYVAFTKKIIAQISYSILLSLVSILVVFISQVVLFETTICSLNINFTEIISVGSTFIFGLIATRLVYFILLIIGNMQSFFYGEIDQLDQTFK